VKSGEVAKTAEILLELLWNKREYLRLKGIRWARFNGRAVKVSSAWLRGELKTNWRRITLALEYLEATGKIRVLERRLHAGYTIYIIVLLGKKPESETTLYFQSITSEVSVIE